MQQKLHHVWWTGLSHSFTSPSPLSVIPSSRDLQARSAHADNKVKRENKELEETKEKTEISVCLVTQEQLDKQVHLVLEGQRDTGYVYTFVYILGVNAWVATTLHGERVLW